MKDFKKGGFGDRGSFRGKPSFGNKPSFKKSWDNGEKSFGGDKQMHPATCSGCGKPCQVPFRPSAGKEVFCNDCFSNVKGGTGYNDRGSRPAPSTGNMDAVVRQLQVVTAKLDQLITLMSATNKPAPSKAAPEKSADLKTVIEEAVTPKAKPAKKAAVKKITKKK